MQYLKLPILLFAFSCITMAGRAQVIKPAKWHLATSVEKVGPGDTLELIFKVTLDDTWYIYSTDFSKEVGPKVAEFHFNVNDSYQLIGGIRPIHPKHKYDEIFMGDVSIFEEKGEFRQTIRVKNEDLNISGNYEYQVCSSVNGKCISFDDDFQFNNIHVIPTSGTKTENYKKKDKTPVKKNVVQPVAKKNNTSPPDKTIKTNDVVTNDSSYRETKAAKQIDGIAIKREPAENIEHAQSDTSGSLWGFAVLAFLAGLTALLTPCVFPMIPMTVTFFAQSGGNKAGAIQKAFVYGLSIIIIYTIAGTLVAWLNGPEFANWLSTHWLPNLFFFGVFIFFALSFLGLFEITLPGGLVNKVDKQADKGGLAGVFFMAFTIVLVSFSCTGPIVGSILVASAGGAILQPIVGMFAFSLAFAIPFSLFAIFPQWLTNLPKSGGWLNTVKVVLGFLELALGLKFLSVADQVYHWGILDREVYLALWITIFTLMGFYLLGKFMLPNDSKVEKLSVTRLMLALACFAFVVYLLPGMFGAPLKALAGYLPPMSTHDYNLAGLARNGQDSTQGVAKASQRLCGNPKYADMLHFPHGIEGYFDIQQALACAKKQNKPVFIDFTGHGCVNCREMEARVWSDPEVLKRLKNDYIMLALYVDEKKELPQKDWYTSTYDHKVKKSIGKQNADYQITRFNNNAQPFYILMDHEQNVLAEPKAYDLNIENFIKFLDEGLEEFKKQAVAS